MSLLLPLCAFIFVTALVAIAALRLAPNRGSVIDRRLAELTDTRARAQAEPAFGRLKAVLRRIGTRAPRSRSESGKVRMRLVQAGYRNDEAVAIFYGIRISLFVGVTATVIALALGLVVGLAAAYFGGIVDAIVMRIVDIQLSFPAILIALVLLAMLGQGVDKIIVALVAVQWAYYARTVRGSALVERRKEYIEAAHCLALPARRIVFRHLLPNVVAPMIVVGTLQTAHAISLEATLSFLGVGLPLTEPSLGLLIANGFEYMLSGKYWISFYPGLALLATIMSINLVGDRLRDILNPRLER